MEIKLNEFAFWTALCVPTFCTVLQVLLLNDKLLGDLVRKAKAMNHTVQMHCTRRAGTLENRIPTHIPRLDKRVPQMAVNHDIIKCAY